MFSWRMPGRQIGRRAVRRGCSHSWKLEEKIFNYYFGIVRSSRFEINYPRNVVF
jgi:hypothetical protein